MYEPLHAENVVPADDQRPAPDADTLAPRDGAQSRDNGEPSPVAAAIQQGRAVAPDEREARAVPPPRRVLTSDRIFDEPSAEIPPPPPADASRSSVPPSFPMPGALPASFAPLSYHGQAMVPAMVPASIMQASGFPSLAPADAGWAAGRWIAAVAVTAVASFVLGVLVASGGLRIRFAQEEPAPAATPAVAAQPPPSPSAAPAAPTAEAPHPAPALVPKAAEQPAEADPGATVEADGSDLPPYRGYLLITSPYKDAYVYVGGKPLGIVGELLDVPCGLRHVRLGTVPLKRWYGQGEPVQVACQELTRFDFRPKPSVPWPGGGEAAPNSRWTPGGL
jgi:hypothetical protein